MGPHRAILLAVDVLRDSANYAYPIGRRKRLEAADALRTYLGKRRLATRNAVRRYRARKKKGARK